MKKIDCLTIILGSSICFLYTAISHAGWQNQLMQQADSYLKSDSTNKEAGSATTTKALTNLSSGEVSAGLKQALNIGLKKSIEMLGREGGFLNDPAVKILMPKKLQQIDKLLRSVGQAKMADEFIVSMNQAAEKALPQVGNVFVDSIQKMSISDAKNILVGADNAATEYFKKTTSEQLQALIQPSVQKSMAQTNVTKHYKSMLGLAKKYDSFGLLKQYLGDDSASLENYVTDKTLSGLFSKIAIQEKAIRNNPAMRSTDLLNKVFGGF
ncbi:MAG: DUF4197 domain-containing protein [Pseudomonadota bacterium]